MTDILLISDPVDDSTLHHLAAEVGDDWKRLATQLNLRRTRLQAILRNSVGKDQEAIIYEMLLSWAKRLPKSMNKVNSAFPP